VQFGCTDLLPTNAAIPMASVAHICRSGDR
jgi:hypothetical protein